MTEFGILIIGHGSREASSVAEFESLVAQYRLHRPELEIRTAHIELTQPDVKTALKEFSQTRREILVVPLFLFTSGHIKNDLPLIIDELRLQFPHHRFLATDTIGVEPKMVQLMIDRFKRGASSNPSSSLKKTGVIVVGRGSSDLDANGDFYKLVRIFEETNQVAFVLPTFVGITQPLLPETLELAAKQRPERLIILPYFLFKGRLMVRLEKLIADFAASYPWIRTELAPYLGPDPILFSILDERIERATQGGIPLPCVTCEYRQQMPGLSSKVGGLKALLWSLRHLETHTQAIPHEFPHKNLKKHILICENVDCASRGSILLISKMRNLIKSYGKQADFRITRTSCMGRCGEGPAVVVYPDGIWYRQVQVEDAEALVNEHLIQDRIVSHRVDNIMQ